MSKPQPKLQIGSPRTRRTVLDDATFGELSGQTKVQEAPVPTQASSALSTSTASADGPVRRAPARAAHTTGRKSAGRGDRKGKSGDPYVRKADGVATVPQYFTLPADLVKRLKLHAVQHDMGYSEVASEALTRYLDRIE